MAFSGRRGFSSVFDDDPFFSGFPAFPGMGPGGFGGPSRHQALGDGVARDRQVAQRRDPFGMMWPFGGEDPFARMHSMMNQMMESTHNDSNCHSYSSSSVMHYSSGGDGRQPKVYHATTSTRQAPGGIKETRKSVHDSNRGVRKMAIGHHINDRSHTIERHINTNTDAREEHHEFVNLEETDAPQFDREFKEKTRHSHSRLQQPSHRPHHSRALLPVESTASRHTKHHPYSTHNTSRAHRHLEPLEPEPELRYSPKMKQSPGDERRHKAKAKRAHFQDS